MTRHIPATLACLVSSVVLMLSSLQSVESFIGMKKDTTKYKAQVKVFVDYAGKQKWMTGSGKSSEADLKADMQILFDQINSIYKSLEQYDLSFQIELKDVVNVKYYDYIIKQSPDYTIDPTRSITEFGTWMSHRYHEQDFDMAVLYTGQNFVVGNSRTLGIAYATPGVCTVGGLILLEMFDKISKDGPPTKLARVTAHEIGHLMGSNHDEDYPLCEHLSDYVMTYYAEEKDAHKYNFTQCSFYAMYKQIQQLTDDGNNCLLPSDSGLTEADQACRNREGSDEWYMSRNYEEYGDKMCESLKCIRWDAEKKKRFVTKGTAAPDGLDCGSYKSCQKGKCVYNPNGTAYRSDTCPWGNQDLRAIGYRNSCEAQSCDHGWKHYCCAHCGALKKELENAQQ